MADITLKLTGKAARPTTPSTVTLTPTWLGVLPLILAGLENGTATGKQIAREELDRMARLADAYVRLIKEEEGEDLGTSPSEGQAR